MKVFGLFCVWILSTFTAASYAADRLIIISPHRKSIQNEYLPVFKNFYKKKYGKEIAVDWLDQGGTENDLRFVQEKFRQSPEGIGIDVFWGGGNITFQALEKEKLLKKISLPKAIEKTIPDVLQGIPLKSENQYWYASALSSFGIFYNKTLLKFTKLNAPGGWQSLGDPTYLDNLSIADPRRSSSSLMMSLIILETLGWNEGWKTLSLMAGNTKKFTMSSSAPIKAVVSGEAAIATAIDFYASAKIDRLGTKSLGFLLPKAQTIINSDPIGILKGTENSIAAERFVRFVLSEQGQKLLLLKKGAADGPKRSYLGRMAISPDLYRKLQIKNVINPFNMKEPQFPINLQKISKIKHLIGDIVGTTHIDLHKQLKSAWKALIAKGVTEEDLIQLVKPPCSEKQVMELAERWENKIFRNQKLNEWTDSSRKKYEKLAQEWKKQV